MPFIQRELILLNGPPWGFRIYEEENRGLIVHMIRKWSPAEVAKLREGDLILAINRRSTNSFNLFEAMNMINLTNKRLSLIVGRHENIYNKRVTFGDYQGEIQENAVSKVLLNLKREPLTTPASPGMEPVPISKLMKEYEIPPRPECAAKKKRFANSEFFNDPTIYYPTIEEKMEMAKMVAESLTSPVNLKSKGANMFEKQKQRIEKYVKEGPDPEPEPILLPSPYGNLDPPELVPPPPPNPAPYNYYGYRNDNYSKVPIPPPSPGAPKTLKEFLERIKNYPTVKHDAVGPEKCFTIAKALHTGDDKGSCIFQKIRTRSQKWEITSETVKQVSVEISEVKYSNPPKPISKLSSSGRKSSEMTKKKSNIQFQKMNDVSLSPIQWRPVKFKIPVQI